MAVLSVLIVMHVHATVVEQQTSGILFLPCYGLDVHSTQSPSGQPCLLFGQIRALLPQRK